MGLFINEDDSLVEAKKTRFTNEKEIQQTVENNLKSMLNLTIVDSEFSFGRHRIDTLAFDDMRKSFVIIEYKNNDDKRISNQVYGYYGDMIANKSDFLLAYHYNIGALRKQDVNWDDTRILLIAPKFDESLLSALRDPNVKFELWKIHRYQHGIIEFKQLRNINNRIEEVDPTGSIDIKPPKVKYMKYHMNKFGKNTQQIYKELERQIMSAIQHAEIVAVKSYIAFTINGHTFIRVYTGKSKLRIYMQVRLKEMNIPKQSNLVIIPKPHTHYGGDSETVISNKSEIVHLMKLVKQSFEKIVQHKLKPTTMQKSEIKTLQSELKRQILDNFERLEFRQKKRYAGFYLVGTNRVICTIEILKSKINLFYNTTVNNKLISQSDFVKNVSNTSNVGPGDYRSDITTESDIARAIPLIEEIYQNRLKH